MNRGPNSYEEARLAVVLGVILAVASPAMGEDPTTGPKAAPIPVRLDPDKLAGVDLPPRKHLVISLRYIFGVGPAKAALICKETSIPENKKTEELTEAEVKRIREFIDGNLRVEGDLRRDISMNIKRLMDLGCNRGIRHRRNLPVRGQRTKTNARTRKGPRKPIRK